MNLLRKVLVPLTVVAVIVPAVMLLVPKAAHAVVAALVQVVNTTANPVPNLDTERNARIPYQSNVFVTTKAGISNAGFFFTTVPTGYRLVAQNVSADLQLESGATVPWGRLGVDGVGGVATFSYPLRGAIGNIFGNGGFSQQITAYADAGSTPVLGVSADFAFSSAENATLTGYLENCSITGCPPIQK
jgi:hypothetical protein